MEETREIEQPHSCEISVNAKGQWSAKVKVYGATSDEAVGKANEKAEFLAKLITEKNNK